MGSLVATRRNRSPVGVASALDMFLTAAACLPLFLNKRRPERRNQAPHPTRARTAGDVIRKALAPDSFCGATCAHLAWRDCLVICTRAALASLDRFSPSRPISRAPWPCPPGGERNISQRAGNVGAGAGSKETAAIIKIPASLAGDDPGVRRLTQAPRPRLKKPGGQCSASDATRSSISMVCGGDGDRSLGTAGHQGRHHLPELSKYG